ncbi:MULTISPECIES: hypothetical protein [unclassified Legionella]|uniref:hypothetical protein n=1 Tax=unclassified Legionella TaxID=2622702 RepID=UPI0010556E10|nr:MULTISPECIES: hypothetical protein [unclassified Legionella]MDI9819555.1 hypothetical protein [Legionella sp. PL877]
MLVHRVHEFINALVSIEDELEEIDQKLLSRFQEKYPLPADRLGHNNIRVNVNDSLNEEQLNWIQECFATRWQEIADKPADYTFNLRANNIHWVRLAKDLAAELGKPYLCVLIPTITNLTDPDRFTRLTEQQELRYIYLDEDGNWRTIEGLFEYTKEKPSVNFCIYDISERLKPRALTLKELFRIRAKASEEFVKRSGKEVYASFWDYLLREIVPTWNNRGECPRHLLPILLTLVEAFFQSGGDSKASSVKACLNNLNEELRLCSLDNINYFYGIPIYASETEGYYLVEILIDCLQGSRGLNEKFANVAKWLCRFDPSLISQSDSLASVYKKFQAGSYFNLLHLKDRVSKLDPGIEELKPKLKKLLEDLDKGANTSEIIKQLRELYSLRWLYIMDHPDDYMRNQEGQNFAWIRLAQYLAGAGYVDANYYKLLIPTLEHDIDPVTQENLTAYPLSHYVLAEDGKSLIYLPNCVGHHKASGTFYNCTANPPKMLTAKELKRLSFANSEFYDYYSTKVLTEETVLAISLETIKALGDLVNGTLNPSALFWGHKISADQESIADKAYEKFLLYMDSMPADELCRLHAHPILWRTKKIQFSTLMDNIQKTSKTVDDRECIAVAGQFWLKLIIDYDPDLEYVKLVEGLHKNSVVAIKEMQRFSAKNTLRDYDHIDQQEATLRVLTTFVSIMTHPFRYVWHTGKPSKHEDYRNTLTNTGQELFNVLQPIINSGDFSLVRHICTYTVQNIVKKALANPNLITKYTRYEDTLSWLKSIEDGSMFKAEKKVCFEPKMLLTVLVAWVKGNSNESVVKFLEQLMQTLLQPDNDYRKWVRINIEFNKMLNSLPEKCEEILGILRQTPGGVSDEAFIQSGVEFLVYRLTTKIIHEASHKQGIFGVAPGQYELEYNKIFNELTGFFKECYTQVNIAGVVEQMKIASSKIAKPAQATIIGEYLQAIEKPGEGNLKSEVTSVHSLN